MILQLRGLRRVSRVGDQLVEVDRLVLGLRGHDGGEAGVDVEHGEGLGLLVDLGEEVELAHGEHDGGLAGRSRVQRGRQLLPVLRGLNN